MPSRTAVYTSLASQAPRPVFGPPRPRAFVVLLQLGGATNFDCHGEQVSRMLRNRAEVTSISSPSAASVLFSESPRATVLATDAGLALDRHAALADEARTFVRNGGCLIFCSLFAQTSKPSAIDDLFERLELYWYVQHHSQRVKWLILAVLGPFSTRSTCLAMP